MNLLSIFWSTSRAVDESRRFGMNSRHLRELLMRIELTTSSLPRKCSTTELQQPINSVFALDTLLFLVRCLSLGLITSPKELTTLARRAPCSTTELQQPINSVFALDTPLYSS